MQGRPLSSARPRPACGLTGPPLHSLQPCSVALLLEEQPHPARPHPHDARRAAGCRRRCAGAAGAAGKGGGDVTGCWSGQVCSKACCSHAGHAVGKLKQAAQCHACRSTRAVCAPACWASALPLNPSCRPAPPSPSVQHPRQRDWRARQRHHHCGAVSGMHCSSCVRTVAVGPCSGPCQADSHACMPRPMWCRLLCTASPPPHPCPTLPALCSGVIKAADPAAAAAEYRQAGWQAYEASLQA